MQLITIESRHTRATVAPQAGGRLHQLEIRDGDAWLPVLVAPKDPVRALSEPMLWSSYPMVPWANRIERGRFTWRGRLYEVDPKSDGNALHGLGAFQPWTVTRHASHSCRIETTFDDRWPFAGRAVQEFRVEGARLTQRIELHSTGMSFPAGVGWHPWFRRDVRPAEDVRVTVDSTHAYETVGMIPTGWLLRANRDLDLRHGPEFGNRRLDTCYRHPRGPLRIRWGDIELIMESSQNVRHAVLYSNARGVCVEPVTTAIDAVNLHAQGVPGTGLQVVRPGRPLIATTVWKWRIGR